MLVAQFVLVNVVVAVLMKHLEESNKEAREDAELDAEVELEMAQGPPARPRPTASPSPGASPDAPNLLVVRKVSVSRMLSLPNDSYMFRPVAPAAAAHPHPLQEVEMETYAGASGTSGTTPRGDSQDLGGRGRPGPAGAGVGPAADAPFRHLLAPGPVTAHLPPVESCPSLQVPSAMSSPARGGDTQRALTPLGAACSPSLSQLLCTQVGGDFRSSAEAWGIRGGSLPI